MSTIEVFHVQTGECDSCNGYVPMLAASWSRQDCYSCSRGRAHPIAGDEKRMGWWYWYCQPGCLPDSDPIGPFDSEEQAWEDAESRDDGNDSDDYSDDDSGDE